MHTLNASHGDRQPQNKHNASNNKSSLIDLSIDMKSLNDMLKNIIDTINQHALLLNGVSTNCQQKFDKISMKILYKNSFTKDLIHKWQSLLSKEQLRVIDNPPKVYKEDKNTTKIESDKKLTGYSAPIGVEYKKNASDIRINKEVVEAEKLLKEYLYQKEFPSFIIQSALKLSDDTSYLHDLWKQNKIDFSAMMSQFKIENAEKTQVFEKSIDEKLEVLHQELINMRHEQSRFCEDTDAKIEQVEKNTLCKIKDYEELLKTRPNKEFVRDITKMECDKVKAQCLKDMNNHIPKLERGINAVKEKFDFVSEDMTQKTNKVLADVNILKEGLNLAQSDSRNKYKSIRESMENKFSNFDAYIIECKDNHKTRSKKMNEFENEIRDIIENAKANSSQNGGIDEDQIQILTNQIRKEFDEKLVSPILLIH